MEMSTRPGVGSGGGTGSWGGTAAADLIGFAAIAARTPDRVAVIDPTGTATNYGELGQRALQVAGALRGAGVGPGDAIGLMAPNSREFIEVWAAAMLVGSYVVPINWHLTGAEVDYILRDAEARALVAHEQVAEAAIGARKAVPSPGLISIGDIDGFRSLDELAAVSDAMLPPDAAAGSPMFYSSGTTGRPKGVQRPLPQRPVGLIGVVEPETTGDTPPDPRVHLACGALYHAHPAAGALGTLDLGGTLVIMDKFDAERWLELVEQHRVTHSGMVPTMFVRLLALPDDVRRRYDLSSLQSVVHAGAPCPVEIKHQMIDWFGPVIDEYYSCSEGARPVRISAEEWLRKPGSVGRPDSPVLVLDGDRVCGPDEPGLLYLEPLWSWEYHGDTGKTQTAFRDGLFTVGDIGYLDHDGYLFLCDRSTDLIISGGTNIYPAEIESTLLEHPSVVDVAVVGVPDPEWGESVQAVVELLEGTTASPTLEADLIEWCRGRLAHFKCPKAIDFVASLDRDPNGKVRKHLIRERYRQAAEVHQ